MSWRNWQYCSWQNMQVKHFFRKQGFTLKPQKARKWTIWYSTCHVFAKFVFGRHVGCNKLLIQHGGQNENALIDTATRHNFCRTLVWTIWNSLLITCFLWFVCKHLPLKETFNMHKNNILIIYMPSYNIDIFSKAINVLKTKILYFYLRDHSVYVF